MEFYLIKKKRDKFPVSSIQRDTCVNKWALSDQQLTLENMDSCVGESALETGNDGGPLKGNSFRKDLMDLLCNNNSFGHDNQLAKSLHLTISLTVTSSNTGKVEILTRNMDNVKVRDAKKDVQLFERLMNSDLPPDSFGFNLKLKLFLIGTTKTTEFEINREDLRIQKYQGHQWNYGLVANIQITDEIWRHWDHPQGVSVSYWANVEGELTLTLRLDHGAVKQLYLERFGKNHFGEWIRKMLTDGFGSDLVILAGGEKNKKKGIKCHKFVLSDRSPVFKTMFETDMSESKEKLVEIKDMTEAGVWALLQFIYCWDLEEAARNCEMAFELLEAGHKYQMEDLEEAMTEIICAMSSFEWFSVDLAVKLLLFSRNVGEKLGKVEKRSLQVLKWYAQKPGSLKASEEYQKLFLENPRIALDIGELFLKI